jgi:arylformamidase
MPLYDATLPIHQEMLTFPGDPRFSMETVFDRRKGDPFNLALMKVGTHLGTHVDPPAHYVAGGATVDEIPLEVMVGPGVILDMRGRPYVDGQALKESWTEDYRRVLLKTDNSPKLLKQDFDEDFVALTQDGAEFLVSKGVKLVGIDYLSIEKYMTPRAPVHHILIAAGVLIVEGVHLLDAPAGPCQIYCLPMKIKGGDGAPARVLIEIT